jgi:hypothetical protein
LEKFDLKKVSGYGKNQGDPQPRIKHPRWFDDAEKEFICEVTGDEVILKKDENNRVIGLEKLNIFTDKMVPIEVMTT